ncbi:endonuclease domain-containing protein [Rhodohalobacter sp. 8-1]|uniref:endonuclease domain-containing protein n=1 Tax=Rhodohalobacter sp. 8-1 TaxID=3131972 RepID=UPI0030ED8E38
MRRPIIPYNPKLKQKARRLRNNSTLSEVILWRHLKGKQMTGFDFHRQRPVGNYIVDFICCELYLVIELDGYTHMLERQGEKDEIRESNLKSFGLHIIRFWDEEVYDEIDNVLRVIEDVVSKQKNKLGL